MMWFCVGVLSVHAEKYFVDHRGAYAALEDAKTSNQELILNSLDAVVQAGLYNKKTKQSKIVFPGDYWDIQEKYISFVSRGEEIARISLVNAADSGKTFLAKKDSPAGSISTTNSKYDKTNMGNDLDTLDPIENMNPRQEVLYIFSYIEKPIHQVTPADEAFLIHLLETSASFKKMTYFFLDQFDQGNDECIGKPGCCQKVYGIEPIIEKFYTKEKNRITYTADYVSHIEQPTPVGESIINSE